MGHVKRGFEAFIADLADQLCSDGFEKNITVYSSAPYKGAHFSSKPLPAIRRFHKTINRFCSDDLSYRLEQYSFFFFLLPQVLLKKPHLIYMGEYLQYCYLYKARKYLRLSYSLALYTGGQTFPGLFDVNRDIIHHITDVYLPPSNPHNNFPLQQQYLIPHFIKENFFGHEEETYKSVKLKAGNKRILLSIGILDNSIKRMSFLADALTGKSQEIFPIFLGQPTKETPAIIKQLDQIFTKEGYILGHVPREQLGSYYKLADLFVLCSLKESFGLIFLEALWHGKQVLCHDFEEAHYVLKNHAVFIDMKDKLLLQKTIVDFFVGYNYSCSIAKHQFVVNNYTWASLKAKYLKMFSLAYET